MKQLQSIILFRMVFSLVLTLISQDYQSEQLNLLIGNPDVVVNIPDSNTEVLVSNLALKSGRLTHISHDFLSFCRHILGLKFKVGHDRLFPFTSILPIDDYNLRSWHKVSLNKPRNKQT
jgi:hypothetical protein